MFRSKKLALHGGPPAITIDQTREYTWPILDNRDREAVLHVLQSGTLSDINYLKQVEKEFAEWLGVKHVLSHCNGTLALVAALYALGVGPGDEVLVQSATFWASATAIVHCGGVPVFIDIEPQCNGIDPERIEENLTPNTKGIIVVHLLGMPSRMSEILEISRRHNLFVLEDASHAHGARYQGRAIGTLGDAAIFSLHASKNLPAGEGGLLVTDSDSVWEKAMLLGQYERLIGARPDLARYCATGFGVNYRMSTLDAAIARTQLSKIDEFNRIRNKNIEYLSRTLQQLGIYTYPAPPGVERVFLEFHVKLPQMPSERVDFVVEALRAEGAQIERPQYPLLHQQPFFTDGAWRQIARVPPEVKPPHGEYAALRLPITEDVQSLALRLPVFPRTNNKLLDQYASAFIKVMRHI